MDILARFMKTSSKRKILTDSPGYPRQVKNRGAKVTQARFLDKTTSALVDWQINLIKDFINFLDQPAIALNSFYKIVHFNNAFLDAYGKHGKKRDQLSLLDYLNKKDLESLKKCLDDIEEDELESCQQNIQIKDKTINVRLKNFKINNEANFILLICTEIKKGPHAQSNILGLVSHELKTPLTAIKAFGQLTSSTLKHSNKRATDYLGKIDEQINRMVGLVDDLFDVSKIHLGKFTITKNPHSLDDLVKETLEEIKLSRLGKHKIIVRGSIKEKINIDKNRIKQVLLNMVSNAIKYSPKADKVIILLKRTPQTAQIKIKDYGRGIDPQNLKNIFDQFRQNKESGGLGLGLYISQKIVKEHDGKINVTSKKGYGSVFTINLPLKKVK